jgi:hypothetical protein
MLDEANSKRRRLDREKRALERPKDGELARSTSSSLSTERF